MARMKTVAFTFAAFVALCGAAISQPFGPGPLPSTASFPLVLGSTSIAANSTTTTITGLSIAAGGSNTWAGSSLTDSGLTAGRVPYAGTAGLLSDDSGFTYNSGTHALTTTTFAGALSGNATTATTSTNLAGGAVGSIPYQSAAGTTTFLNDVATGQVLLSGGVTTAPAYGALPLTAMATQATNTVVGNATSGSAAPTALAVGTCSTTASALIWTTNTGFGCNTSINAATLGGATFAAPGAIGGGTAAAITGTTITGTSFVTASASGTYGFGTYKAGSTQSGYWSGNSNTGPADVSGNFFGTATDGSMLINSGNNAPNVAMQSSSVTYLDYGATTASTLTGARPTTFSSATFKLTGITTGTNADTVCLSAAGVVLIQAAACTISSRRFKTDIRVMSTPLLAQLEKLPVFTFRLKDEDRNKDRNAARPQMGLMAEDVAKIMPICALYEADMKTPKSYRQECVIAALVKGMQEQEQEIKALRTRLQR